MMDMEYNRTSPFISNCLHYSSEFHPYVGEFRYLCPFLTGHLFYMYRQCMRSLTTMPPVGRRVCRLLCRGLSAFGFLLLLSMFSCSRRPPQLGAAPLAEVQSALTDEEKVALVVGLTHARDSFALCAVPPVRRLGIPPLAFVRSDSLWPHVVLAASWDEELARCVGSRWGAEARSRGAGVVVVPGPEVQRNILQGGISSCRSEDPLLSGLLAAALVEGVQQAGVGAALAGLGARQQQTNRRHYDARVSARALRELYLKGYETTLRRAVPWAVLTVHNYLNGIPVASHARLLDSWLRGEQAYEGVVGGQPCRQGQLPARLAAGCDVLLPATERVRDELLASLRDGRLVSGVMERCVGRVLRLAEQLVESVPDTVLSQFSAPEAETLVRQLAAASMVLLKNDSAALPLRRDSGVVALYGAGGGRPASVRLARALATVGLPTDTAGTDSLQLTVDVARCSAAVVLLSRPASLRTDRRIADFLLSPGEVELLRRVCTAYHSRGRRVIVVLDVAGPVETESWKHLPDAILCAWQGGGADPAALAAVLAGTLAPEGRLPLSFPVRYADTSSALNFPTGPAATADDDTSRPHRRGSRRNVDHTAYEEGIYVGYRYFDSFGQVVSYPFGHGLSYTSFASRDAALTVTPNGFDLPLTVETPGLRPGREVVQLYVAAPDCARHNRPDKELKAFAKTCLLRPGEEQRLTLHVPLDELARYDEPRTAWITDAGCYEFQLGASSADIRARLQADVPVAERKAKDVLGPERPLGELTR